jgi:hypothetical protein
MAPCVSCGEELDPERAQKYDYCTRPECRVPRAVAVATKRSSRRVRAEAGPGQAPAAR